MILRPPRSTLSSSSAASDVYKRQRRRVLQPLEPGRAEVAGQRAKSVKAVARLVLCALVLHNEQRPRVARQQRRHACEGGEVRRRAERVEVEQLDRGGTCLEDRDVGLQGGAQGGERQRRPHPRRWKGVERHLELGEQLSLIHISEP